MEDELFFALALAAGIAVFVITNVVARFEYVLTDDELRMRWLILRFIPLMKSRLPLDVVEEAKPAPYGLRWGYEFVFGNRFPSQGVHLRLKDRRLSWYFARRVYVSPENAEQFIVKVRQKIRERAQ